MFISLETQNPLTDKALEGLKNLGIEMQVDTHPNLTFITSIDKRFGQYFTKRMYISASSLYMSVIRVYNKETSADVLIPLECIDTIYDL